MSLPAHVYRRDAGRPGPHGVGPGVLMPLAFLVLASWVSALATDAGTSPSGTPDEPPPRAPTAPATGWTESEWPTISLSLQDSYHGTDLTRLGGLELVGSSLDRGVHCGEEREGGIWGPEIITHSPT